MAETTTDIQMVETSLWRNRKCLAVCTVIAIANLQYGLDTSAVGALQAMPGFLMTFGFPDPGQPGGYGIEYTFQQLISSLMTLGAFLSSSLAGLFALRYGRKTGLYVASVFSIIACALQIASTEKAVIYLGRFLLGAGNGFFATFSTIYLAEAAPAHLRGIITALFTFWIVLGNILGTTIDYCTSKRLDNSSYQIPLGCLFIVPVVICVSLPFIPESPRYLLYHGKVEKARKALEFLRADSVSQEYIELEWAEMMRGREEEHKHATSASWLDMFKGVNLRRTLLCYGAIAIQCASGIWFIIAYQTYFFVIIGVTEAFQYSIMNTSIGFAATVMGMISMRSFMGRRSMLMLGATICGISQLVTAVVWTVYGDSPVSVNVLIGFWAVYYFFYSFSIGVTSYPVASEVVNNRMRAWTVGSATSLGYVLAWLCTFCTPYFINPTVLNWGAKYNYIWAGSNFMVLAFVYFFIPETKGRSLEELAELFDNKVSVRDFRTYHTTLLQEAVREVQTHTGMLTNQSVPKIDSEHIEKSKAEGYAYEK